MKKNTIAPLLLALALGAGVPAEVHAQDSEWDRLDAEATELDKQGQYDQAIAVAKKALQTAEDDKLGPNYVAASLDRLASLYWTQRQFTQAEPLYKRTLAIREQTLGPDHPDLVGSLGNLALVYQRLGQYTQAELLHKRVLAIKEKALGPNHPFIALIFQGMASIYRKTNREKDALELEKRAAAIQALKQ